MRMHKRAAIMQRELMASERIPYAAHVAGNLVNTVFGDYVQIFRLAGASFESADDEQLNAWHERLNVLWRNIASAQVALWAHVIRRREAASDERTTGGGFANALHDKYRQRLRAETLMVNEWYLSIVYRPTRGTTTSLVSKLLAKTQRDGSELELRDAFDASEKLGQIVAASLARYEPEALGVYRKVGRVHSSLLEFLAYLINGEAQPMPLPRAPLFDVLATTRLSFGTEAIEYRLPTATRVGAMLGIKEYPSPSAVGMYDRLLSAPFAFVLTQSFAFLSKAAGQTLLQRQYNRMANAGDFAISQAEELKDALDALTSNQFVMGEHHFSLQVIADVADGGADDPKVRRLKVLNDQVGLARSMLADTGMTVAREDLAVEAVFWAQLPDTLQCVPVRRRSRRVTSARWRHSTTIHQDAAPAITGATR